MTSCAKWMRILADDPGKLDEPAFLEHTRICSACEALAESVRGLKEDAVRLETVSLGEDDRRDLFMRIGNRLAEQEPVEPRQREVTIAFLKWKPVWGAGVVVLLALADTLAVWGPKLEKEHWRTLLHVAQTLWQTYFEKNDEIVAPDPLLNGHDLIAMGLQQGPTIGRILESLREAQAAGDITTREAAEAFVRQWQSKSAQAKIQQTS